ncbi:M81 family metallopeptidase [Fodinicola feengrottensis]|uniref:M81 family metallopeptidase n=1 Tax=Fodinicola feengrottensis TaxID=435914 RepID=UPI0028BE930D|nr:M81 family metallopeptidase [Fodinicola feengrottensis]
MGHPRAGDPEPCSQAAIRWPARESVGAGPRSVAGREKNSTRLEPARSVYAKVDEVEATDGVLDAAIWVGYAWADEPRCQAAVVVTATIVR